ncbi:NAD-dependent epimerase/dehydratase family protein [Cellvibrio sp. KY-YJ-3]|uniref:NAD-dependent epimerase/dehydratase family protein n=1 Tax=Cellvibrio sp. KY-YJ-3 TaxID=454662 RepID=UPI0012492228|nr:NAD-dependent epimerase/dehydratase family protein [Cellvibrio sp. KY-YJ-3]QEY11323.1 NAD-dependent epimerase/dehydratase family protein [Cellvibrio sp. KY-YJ-3]
MRLVVTGANGYLGRALCPLLVAQGHAVTTLTRAPFELEGTSNQILHWQQEEQVRACLQGQEGIIHLAALAHQAGRSDAATEALYMTVNFEQTRRLATLALARGVRRFIYISSIKVNGEATFGTPYRFDSPAAPQDIYGRSKWAAEQALHQLLDGTTTELVIIRPPLIWGGVMKGNLALLQRLVTMGVPLPFAGLNNRRDLVSLDNLCSLIALALVHPEAAGQTLLVSDGQARSTADIIRLITSGLESRPRLIHCPRWLLAVLALCPGLGAKLDKLSGDLEVDIQPTCARLGWRPKP